LKANIQNMYINLAVFCCTLNRFLV
jgi:hypothetical protein